MHTSRFWKALSGALCRFCLCCLFTFAATGYGYWQHQGLQQETLQAEQAQLALQQRAQFLRNYQPLVQWYRSHQAQWLKSGFMQAAQPAQWAASWATMQQQYQLPHMQYTIHEAMDCHPARCPLTVFPDKAESAGLLTVTPIALHWQLQHEADTLQWLQRLQQYYGPMLQIQSCRWAHQADAVLIDSQCQLLMINIPTLLVSPPAA